MVGKRDDAARQMRADEATEAAARAMQDRIANLEAQVSQIIETEAMKAEAFRQSRPPARVKHTMYSSHMLRRIRKILYASLLRGPARPVCAFGTTNSLSAGVIVCARRSMRVFAHPTSALPYFLPTSSPSSGPPMNSTPSWSAAWAVLGGCCQYGTG